MSILIQENKKRRLRNDFLQTHVRKRKYSRRKPEEALFSMKNIRFE